MARYSLFTSKSDTVLDRLLGYYDSETGKIFINRAAGKEQRRFIYWHEFGHLRCHASNCFCWKQTSEYWREYHAMKYELHRVINCADKKVRAAYAKNMLRALYGSPRDAYDRAAVRLIKTKQFFDFCEALDAGDEFTKLLKEYEERCDE